MADRTRIEVTEATWNPITGCSSVSEGCRRCYAARFAKRLAGRYGYPQENPFAVTVHSDLFGQPGAWRKPRHIFTCSMGDLFHADVPGEALQRVVRAMAENTRHTYMVITKRPERMAAFIRGLHSSLRALLKEILWLGVTVENQERAEERLPWLVENWPGLRLACVEPMLGPVDLSPWLGGERGLDWVICGGETGPGGRTMDPDHARGLRNACLEAGVPFYLKHFGGPDKKLTGRTLDGRTWDQMPPYRR
ncbi:DUF5131 family protein [Desulfohalovibrio reitneri]|uniref:DUF5131 family protein n=1 Tax=Desulfohalovibrio reitneri TaxID=1307759 RepID=UPI0005572027|nr:phage Gp37/Gp68 family protein [Desulfohalovibrio reitneri]